MKASQNERGMALLITLAVVSAIITVTLYLHRETSDRVMSFTVFRDRMQMDAMNSSAVEAVMAVLVADAAAGGTDSLQEDWADPETWAEISSRLDFENGTVAVSVTDERGKIQVNALVDFPKGRYFNGVQRNLWDHFLRLVQLNDPESMEATGPEAILNPLKDWLDSGDDDAITGQSGAESDYYLKLDPPYPAANGRFTHVDELFLVRSISRERLANTAFGPVEIGDFVTVFGASDAAGGKGVAYDGAININTASAVVIAAMLPEGEEDLAGEIVAFRDEKTDGNYLHDLSTKSWYKKVPGCSSITIPESLYTVSSHFFRIDAAASLNGLTRMERVYLRRVQEKKTSAWTCEILMRERVDLPGQPKGPGRGAHPAGEEK